MDFTCLLRLLPPHLAGLEVVALEYRPHFLASLQLVEAPRDVATTVVGPVDDDHRVLVDICR